MSTSYVSPLTWVHEWVNVHECVNCTHDTHMYIPMMNIVVSHLNLWVNYWRYWVVWDMHVVVMLCQCDQFDYGNIRLELMHAALALLIIYCISQSNQSINASIACIMSTGEWGVMRIITYSVSWLCDTFNERKWTRGFNAVNDINTFSYSYHIRRANQQHQQQQQQPANSQTAYVVMDTSYVSVIVYTCRSTFCSEVKVEI
jgi:hypothetical protein